MGKKGGESGTSGRDTGRPPNDEFNGYKVSVGENGFGTVIVMEKGDDRVVINATPGVTWIDPEDVAKFYANEYNDTLKDTVDKISLEEHTPGDNGRLGYYDPLEPNVIHIVDDTYHLNDEDLKGVINHESAHSLDRDLLPHTDNPGITFSSRESDYGDELDGKYGSYINPGIWGDASIKDVTDGNPHITLGYKAGSMKTTSYVSDYAGMTHLQLGDKRGRREDFADSVDKYLRTGDIFKEETPNRAKLLDDIFIKGRKF